MKIYKILLSSVTAFMLVFLMGCQNTMEGFGKDMQQNGKKIENSNK